MKYKFIFSLICFSLLLGCNQDNPITLPAEPAHEDHEGHVEGDEHPSHEEGEADKEKTESGK